MLADEHLPAIHNRVDAKAVTAAAAVRKAEVLYAGTTSARERERERVRAVQRKRWRSQI